MIRHGITDWNREHRFQGQIDIPLCPEGEQQAERLGARFGAPNGAPSVAASFASFDISAIYSSDLRRAYRTAEPIAIRRGLPIRSEVGLRERAFGQFEGMTLEEIQRTHAEQYRRWRAREPDFAIAGGGESLSGFYGRVTETMTRLASAHFGQAIVLLTHGGVLDCAYRATGIISLSDPFRPPLLNTAVNLLLYRNGRFELESWGDIEHLTFSCPP
jgi:2,3-bisphosphoglycerate-dependent phosphoglycerate mutase